MHIVHSLVLFAFMISAQAFAETPRTYLCNSSIIDLELPAGDPLLKGVLRIELSSPPKAWLKATGEDVLTETNDVTITNLQKPALGDELSTLLMKQLSIDYTRVQSATMYAVRSTSHVSQFIVFFDGDGHELGRGGLIDMFALFRCELFLLR